MAPVLTLGCPIWDQLPIGHQGIGKTNGRESREEVGELQPLTKPRLRWKVACSCPHLPTL